MTVKVNSCRAYDKQLVFKTRLQAYHTYVQTYHTHINVQPMHIALYEGALTVVNGVGERKDEIKSVHCLISLIFGLG